jgi:phage-related baseplate assembly protein
VEIREGLAEENFAAYGPDLARSFAVLSAYQQKAEAKALLARARELIEPFAIDGTPNGALLSQIQEMLKALKRP